MTVPAPVLDGVPSETVIISAGLSLESTVLKSALDRGESLLVLVHGGTEHWDVRATNQLTYTVAPGCIQLTRSATAFQVPHEVVTLEQILRQHDMHP